MSLETPPAPPERHVPGRWQALLFHAKTRVFQTRRFLREIGSHPARHGPAVNLLLTPVVAEKRGQLWRELTPAEFPLTAGKVENLRHAAAAFDGVEIPAGAVFSFWRQLGRTSRGKGFTEGRELREGCMVPALGGGLCQLSGLLYQAAMAAGLEVVERHAHSRIVPGSAAEQNLDATVFWNYVDLRFRSHAPWRLEVVLSESELIVRIRMASPAAGSETTPLKAVATPPAQPRSAPSGDCLTCGMVTCFRHPSATASHAASLGHSAFLVDALWPEFDDWCREHSREGDHWLLPLNALRWRKPNYGWTPPPPAKVRYATAAALVRSFRQRRLPSQGALRQATLLEGDAAMARRYAAMLHPECRHVVVSQNLLPHLWQTGALGGRSFDVLLVRHPLSDLQGRLDHAAQAHPESATLADFRAPQTLVRAEQEALAAAGRLITPHRDLARRFGHRAWLLDWAMPKVRPIRKQASQGVRFFLPCSPLARKGVHELAAALKGVDVELLVLGGAREEGEDPLKGIHWRRATIDEISDATAVVLPAWVEHQPRLALKALAAGVPVVATRACGLPDHPDLHVIPDPGSPALPRILRALAHPDPACVSATSSSAL